MAKPVIVWFRRDLRLQDNLALNAARNDGAPVIPVYIQDDAAEVGWRDGEASRFMEKSSRLRDDSMLGLQIDGILQRGVTHIENACKEGKPASPQLIKELEALISEARTLNNKSTSRTPAKKLKEMIQALLKSSQEWAEKNSI